MKSKLFLMCFLVLLFFHIAGCATIYDKQDKTSSHTVSNIPVTWLVEKISVDDVDATSSEIASEFKTDNDMKEKMKQSIKNILLTLKSKMKDGDEIWYFCSPKETWRALYGQAGYVIVRDGKTEEGIVTVLN